MMMTFLNFFENKQNSGRNWLKVKLEGSTIDRLAIGSRVKVFTGATTQMREVTSGGGGYLSQSTRVLHFGLMDIETIDSLEVIWTGKRIRSTSDFSKRHKAFCIVLKFSSIFPEFLI